MKYPLRQNFSYRQLTGFRNFLRSRFDRVYYLRDIEDQNSPYNTDFICYDKEDNTIHFIICQVSDKAFPKEVWSGVKSKDRCYFEKDIEKWLDQFGHKVFYKDNSVSMVYFDFLQLCDKGTDQGIIRFHIDWTN